MNIVVCIKQVPDVDGPIELDAKEGTINKLGLHSVVNPYDLLAVEEAVRIRERYGTAQVIAVCLGTHLAEKALRSCLAIGVDRAVLLSDRAFDNSDSYATTVILAKAISLLPYDLILCGQKAADSEEGQVGAILAEKLGLPMASRATKIDISADYKKTEVQRKLEKGGREIVEIRLPAVLSVETGLNKPRYPRVRSILAAQRGKIEEYSLKTLGLSLEEVGIKGSKTQVLNLSPPKPKTKKPFTPDSCLPAIERLLQVMAGGVREKSSEPLHGDVENMALKLVQFLCEQKFIR